MSNVAIVGPVHPYRAGIAYCTTELARRLGADVFSFSRQYPRFLYPGGDDVDPTLPRAEARFDIDVMNPLTWIRAGWRLRQYDAVIFVWWIWVWALPYRVMMALLRRGTRVILQCHNIGDKEPAAWKRALTNIVLRRGRILVTHAMPEAAEAWKRSRGRRVVRSFLPVHELGGAIPTRAEARKIIGADGNLALFFGHVRPFKGLDIALKAWPELQADVTLLVAGEAWWNAADEYRKLAPKNVRFDFRFIPDAEIATWFAAADVVLAPYRIEAQSGVALTAFHFARPVIATRVGGLPEIIEEGRNGMLIPPEDPSALARAVDAFFARSDREQLERHAAASARKYSWEEYAALFRRLLSGG
ncbi:MAG TPA: glycosyltransferase [Thermoanaerobaculia bacterium]|nr:glycosyltransferase [Thermoanaerobaculia bacterium]